MAYTNNWNESAPTGSEAANTIDDLFRSLKVDIRERLQDLFPGWTNDSEDPKVLSFGRCQVVLTSSESIADTTLTAVPWDSAVYDEVDDYWTSGTDLTIPSDGFYIVTFNAVFSANATGFRSASIYNSGVQQAFVRHEANSTAASFTALSVTFQGEFTASDVITGRVYQNSGGSLGLETGGTSLSIVRLS